MKHRQTGREGRWRGRGSGCNDNNWNGNGERNKELKTNIVVTLSKQTSSGLNRHLSKQHDAEIDRAIDPVPLVQHSSSGHLCQLI